MNISISLLDNMYLHILNRRFIGPAQEHIQSIMGNFTYMHMAVIKKER